MSLINQMLRDLEQRKTMNAPAGALPPLQSLRYQPQHKRPSLGWLSLAAIPLAWLVLENLTPSAPPEPAKSLQTITRTPESTLPDPVAEQPQSIPQPALPAIAPPIPAPPTPPMAIEPQSLPVALPMQPLHQAPAKGKNPPTQNPIKSAKSHRVHPSIPAAEQQAEALYKQAQSSVSRMMRKEVLHEALQLHPRHLPARQLLLQTLLQENATSELKAFLEDSLDLFPGHSDFVRALAHWQIKQKNFNAATSALEQLDDGNPRDPQHLALLAAGYQQQQHFAQALPLYEKLTLIQPEKAENWLGLALCTDHLQQPGRAVQAYRQALRKNTLHDEVVDYINQRLSALTP